MKKHRITFKISGPRLNTVGSVLLAMPTMTTNEVLVSRARRVVLKGLHTSARRDTCLEVIGIEKDV